jgi:uncharacterized protein (UPF0335 family)
MQEDLKHFLKELRYSEEKIKQEKEQIKAIKDKMTEQLGLDKKVLAKVIKLYLSDKLQEEIELMDTVQGLLEG